MNTGKEERQLRFLRTARLKNVIVYGFVVVTLLSGVARGQSLLPPDEVQKGHPQAKQIESVLARQAGVTNFVSTGLKRDDYLRIVAGQVKVMRAYQDGAGRIVDPVRKEEFAFTTPCYAHAVATLAASGFVKDEALLASGRKAMDVAIADMVAATCASGHGDFYTYSVMLALEQFQKVLPADQIESWRKRLAGMDPSKTYRAYNSGQNNWGLVNTGGEFLRSLQGLTSAGYVERMLQRQKGNFTAQGLYRENGNPFAYDAFSRYYLTGMLHRGYHGDSFDSYRNVLWKGAWTSLLIQSPFGELPTCYRSAHHIWNEAELAKIYEVYAAHYAKAGRLPEAGAFKRGARLALQSVNSWIRPDGSGYIVKNRYPVEAKHGYESYSVHACYNMLACSMLCAAWLYADDSIEEKPAPADLGGFVVQVDGFDMVVANAGGTYVQYMTRGNQKYNPTGLIRVHLKSGHPQLGPSDGVVHMAGGHGFTSLAVGPAWVNGKGEWRSLAEFPGSGKSAAGSKEGGQLTVVDEGPDSVVFDVKFKWQGVDVAERLRLSAEGVRVEDEVSGGDVAGVRVCYPMHVFDGLKETRVAVNGSRATLDLDGRGVQYEVVDPVGVKLARQGERAISWNGMVEPLYADVKGLKVTYLIAGRGDLPAGE